MTAATAPVATRAEKERAVRDLIRLCEIESPSGRERAVADAVTRELREVGLEVAEDSSAAETGSDAGNLLARIVGPPGAPSVLFCAHLDTVPLEAPVEVVESEGLITNRNRAILGADNKAAVVVLLALARQFASEPPPIGVELLFTTCEEVGLRGAKAFDQSRLESRVGFVFDHASPIGELIVAAPTLYRIEGRFRGASAHAGIRPEVGRSAIVAAANALAALEFGRIDHETTANVGRIEGGSAINVVPAHCRVELEARSLDHDRAGDVVARIVDALTAGASDAECDVELIVEEEFRAYRLSRSAPPVQAAIAALEQLGIDPQLVPTGGASDANVFQARGLQCLNVANGTEHNHEPDESVTVAAVETMLDVALGLVAASA